jgi:hypothetical protein
MGRCVLCLLLSSCTARIEGALFWGENGTTPPYAVSTCVESHAAVQTADRFALVWATVLDGLGMADYPDVIAASRGRRACILNRPEICATADGTDQSAMANGCGGRDGFWVAGSSLDNQPRNWHLSILHEISHVIAQRLGMPDSWSHDEPIHSVAEPVAVEVCGTDCKY